MFEINDDYPTDLFYETVRLQKIKDTQFNGCTFQNLIYDELPANTQTCAVKSIDSKFRVRDSANPSTLSGYTYGIRASATVAAVDNRVTIRDNDFSKMLECVHANASSSAWITGNTFNIGNSDFYTGMPYGLFFDTGSNFTMSGNHFVGENYLTASPRGMYIKDTGGKNQYIRYNTFDDLRTGIDVVGLNQTLSNPFNGLQINCNEFNLDNPQGTIGQAAKDIVLSPGATIARNQGSPSLAAGNSFTPDNISGSDYHNGGMDMVNYYYYTGDINHNPNPFFNIAKFEVPFSPNCTPGFFTLPYRELDLIEKYFLEKDSLFHLEKNVFQSLIDGNDSEALLAQVQSANAGNANAVKSTLLSLSPYLSESVLFAAFERSDIFSQSARVNLLTANPDVLKSGAFFEQILSAAPMLSAAQLDSLEQARLTGTARTDMEAELSYLSMQRSELIDEGINVLLEDSIVDYTALRNWWAYYENFESDLQIAESYLNEQDTDGWEQQLTAMSNADLSPGEAEDLVNYAQYRQILLDASAGGRGDGNLREPEIEDINDIATANDRYVSRLAKNLLEWYYDYQFDPPGEEESEERMDGSGSKKIVEAQTGARPLKVFPNPATTEVVFEWIAAETHFAGSQLDIYNVFGERVKSMAMNTSQLRVPVQPAGLSGGMYYFTLRSNDALLQSGKFTIKH